MDQVLACQIQPIEPVEGTIHKWITQNNYPSLQMEVKIWAKPYKAEKNQQIHPPTHRLLYPFIWGGKKRSNTQVR